MHDSPDTTEDALHRGMQRARVYDWHGASEAFRKSVALDPDNLEARFRLGWGLWNEAESERPSLADMAVAYGAGMLGFDQAARMGRRRYQKYTQGLNDAVHYLRSVVDRDEHHARAWHYLARAYKSLDRPVDAEHAATRAAALDPANANYRNLASQYEQPAARDVGGLPVEALTWDDLVLDAKTKRELRQMQLMLEQPELARDLGVDAPTGVLLKGPPGTGKTTIARILAHEAKCAFFSISPAEVHQMYVGESEKRVRDLFARARASAPAIIFIDEIDALLPVRQGGIAIHSDKVVNQFLQEMDGLKSPGRVFIVGATNRPDMLDPAVRRGGRLSREIEIPLPDAAARAALFALCTRHAVLAPDVNLDDLAARTEGYSGADVRALVNEAGLQALIRISEAGENAERSLAATDFAAAIQNLG